MGKKTPEVKIPIVGESKVKKGLDQADRELGTFGSKVGKWAKGIAAAGAVAVAGIGVVGGGLLNIGSQFDEAYDGIIVATGATGDQLDGLKDDFRAVVSSVPTDFASASTAIGELNTRLGLTGQPLQDVSAQMLDLTRLTGGDIGTNAKNITRLFGDWGVAADDQALSMDKLFRVTQITGIGLDELTSTVVNYGAPMRQMGFTLDEATGLLGKFHVEGVNTEAILAGMKAGLGKMAKAGEEPIETFARVTDAIKNAGSQGEANGIALEAFGSRAGPDMAAAIREGRFELGNLTDQLAGSGGAIAQASDDTESWTEKWQILKNKALLKIEPIAMRLFNGMGTLMDKIAPKLGLISSGLSQLFGGDAAGAGVDIGAAFGFAEDSNMTDRIIGGLETIQSALGTAQSFIVDDVVPAGQMLAGVFVDEVIPAFVTAGDWVRDNVLPVLENVVGFVKANATPIFAGLAVALAGAGIVSVVGAVSAATTALIAAGGVLGVIGGPITLVILGLAALAAGVVYAYKNFDEFRAVVDFAMAAIVDGVQSGVEFMVGLWELWGDDILQVLEGAWTVISAQFQGAFQILMGLWETFAGLFSGDWGRMWDGIKQVFGGFVTAITGTLGGLWQIVTGIFGGMFDGVRSLVGSGVTWVVDEFKALPGRLLGVAGGIIDSAKGIGRGIWDGIVSGLKAGTGAIGNVAESIWNGLKRFVNDNLIGPIRNFGATVFGRDIRPFKGLEYLAQGGVTSGPALAVVGDNFSGQELVAPLPSGFDVANLATKKDVEYARAETFTRAGDTYVVKIYAQDGRDARRQFESWVEDRERRNGRSQTTRAVGSQ